jgi:galactokinase
MMSESRSGIRDELPRARKLWRVFESKFGSPPLGVWAAPGRVNLIGEHTDYNEGFALPLGIEQRALVAVRPRRDDELRLESRQAGYERLRLEEVAPGRVSGWAAYVAGAAWAAIQDGAAGTGLDLMLDSDVPIGAGLSSSAAVECASLVAVAELWGMSRQRLELARLAQRAEIEIAGVPCGLMDQLTSMCAEPEHALCLDFRSLHVEPLPLPLETAGLRLLVIDTRSPHQLADGAYAERRSACHEAAEILGVRALRDATPELLLAVRPRLAGKLAQRARHVVTENARVLSAVAALREAGQERGAAVSAALARLGPILSASHASLRDDFEVTVPRLDVAAAAAERAGALGARMIGGGFGGSVLALVREPEFDAVANAVREAFLEQGWEAPLPIHAQAGAGAGRLL